MHGLELIKQLNDGLHDLPGRALPMTVLTTHEPDPTNKPQQDSSYDDGSSVDIGVAPSTTKSEVRCEGFRAKLAANTPPSRGCLSPLDDFLRQLSKGPTQLL